MIVKVFAGLSTLFTLTQRFSAPAVALGGTVQTICVSDHEVVDAAFPRKRTVLVPFVAPKPVPLIVTVVPAMPLLTLVDEIDGEDAMADVARLVGPSISVESVSVG